MHNLIILWEVALSIAGTQQILVEWMNEMKSLKNWQRTQVWEAVGPTEGSAMQNSNYKLLREYTVALKSQSISEP